MSPCDNHDIRYTIISHEESDKANNRADSSYVFIVKGKLSKLIHSR